MMSDSLDPAGRPTPSGANLNALRGHNRALVLAVIRTTDGLSRVEIAQRTGLTAQAVSKIVGRLIAAGVIAESGHSVGGVGKPRTRLRLVADNRFALGAQIDRDALRLVLVDLAGTVIDRQTRTLDETPTPEIVLDLLAADVTNLVRRNGIPADRLLGLGVGIPGPLDHLTGVVRGATALPGWSEVPLRELLLHRVGLPVIVDKDVTTAVVAEFWRRPEALGNGAVVYVGTGIGAGLLLGGQVHRGSRTNAGEFGHTTLFADGPRCACGRRGCVEAVSGPSAVVRRIDRPERDWTEVAPEWRPSVAARFAEICAAAEDGDLRLRAELERAARMLATAVVDLVELLDLDQVVLGGRAVMAGQRFFRPAVVDALAEQLPRPDWLAVEVRYAGLGDDLVAAGAAMLLLSAYYGARPLGHAGLATPAL